MIKLPQNNQWTQPNNSYKMGSLWSTKNITLDEEGIIKLSPRTVSVYDTTDDADFDLPVAFGRYTEGTFYVATKDEPFNVSMGGVSISISEDASSNNPNLTTNSHGVWFKNAFHETTSQNVRSVTAGTWTADLISNLASTTTRHYMAVFKNKNSLAISDGNLVKLYDSSYSNTATLTLPSDFEVIGLAYNYYKLGIITRLGSDSSGQNANAYFFTWDGATSEAGTGVDIGSYTALSIVPYKSSFVVLTGEGQLLYWNGGGFDVMTSFPFYYTSNRFADNLNLSGYGDTMIVDGDTILINVTFNLDASGYKGEEYLPNNPSGIWCYDPNIGLYHKYSPSISRTYNHWITTGNVNTSTDIITTSGTIPATGNPIIFTGTSGSAVGGITNRKIYYIIKLSSTTFQVAETKEKALAGVYVNLTSQTDNVFAWLYDLKDYGATKTGNVGAIAFIGAKKDYYTDIIAGTTAYNTANSTYETMFMAVPYLENVGYFITPKLFLNSKTETIQSLVIKHRLLDINDKIIVKSKMKDYLGIPTTSIVTVSTRPANWTSDNEFYTETDMNEVKTRFDAGDEMEIEFLSGAGAGQLVKVTGIEYSAGVYGLTLEDSVIGASAGLKSQFVIDNWKVCGEINYTNQTEGVTEIPISGNGKAPQFKIELRGIGTAIEDIFINNKPHKPV